MAELLNSVPTQNAYSTVCSLGPATGVSVINFSILNQPAFVQFHVPVPGYPGKYAIEGIERAYVANTFGAFATNVAGIRFRSAIAGSPALINAEMAFVNDPKIIGGTLAGVGVTSGGQITPIGGSMITGRVAASGAINAGTGFSVSHDATGFYTVTFTSAFSAIPTCMAISDGAGTIMFITLVAAGSFGVRSWIPPAFTYTDSNFHFIATATV